MPSGNPLGYLFKGGQGGAVPQQPVPYRSSGQPGQGGDVMAMMAALEEEKKKRQLQGVLSLVGLAALSQSQAAPAAKAPTSSRGGGGATGNKSAPLEGGTPKSLGGGGAPQPAGGVAGAVAGSSGARARRDRGAQSVKVSGLPEAGTGAAKSGLMSSPLAAAGAAGGLELLGGLLGGDGGAEELEKDRQRAEGQRNLFDGIRGVAGSIRRRQEELRSSLAGLGR
jgi:hypothetical protein